jgi:transposase
MRRRHELSDEQWEAVEPLIPRSTATTGRPASDPRRMLDGLFWVLSTGAPWRDLPADRFGPWQTVYDHFSKWRKSGVFASIIEALQVELDNRGYIDWELWCVDGASVRAARAAAGAEKKVSTATATSPPTTRWAAAAAGSGRSSTWSPTVRATRSPSRSRPGRSTSRPSPSRSSAERSSAERSRR